ncbi:M20/M25/M40 family metallo-hydrolase [Pendulispora brunnea]|uniref:Vacuolar membrane protease n=1 Tax=Pendulispora brunnea TaxID=2905690 RepID=A0ABZ2K0C9_9BACT
MYAHAPRSTEPLEHRRLRLPDTVGILLYIVVALLAIRSVVGRSAEDLVAEAPDFDLARAVNDVGAMAQHRHPLGSPEHDKVREYIEAELRAAGLEVHTQEALSCTIIAFAENCGRVRNVVGRIPGTGGGDVVLFSAHYDSVPTSYGASDDGAGSAALLAVARRFAKEPPARNDIVVLFADAEEDGLLGAAAFVRENPLAKRVRAFVNFEARGTHGASAMYASTPGSAPLLRAFAASAVRPASDSFVALLANTLPNGADSMVYEHAGLAGLSFAFADGLENYHTERDSLANTAQGSLAHHAVQALALAHALRDADLAKPSTEANPAHFDVLGRWAIAYPAWLARLLALGAVVAVIVTIARRPSALRLLAWALALVAAATLVAIVLGTLVRTGASIETSIAHAASSALGIVVAGGSLLVALVGRDAARPWGRAWTEGLALLFAALTAFIGVVAPQASFAFALPALAMALQSRLRGDERRLAWWVLAAVPLYVFGRVAALIAVLMGGMAPPLSLVFSVFAVAPIAARFLARPMAWSLLGAAFVGGVALAAIPLHARAIPHDPNFGVPWPAAQATTAKPPPSATVESRTVVDGRTRLAVRLQPTRGGARIELRASSEGRLVSAGGTAPMILPRFSLETDRRLLRLLYPALAPDSLYVNILAPHPNGERIEIDVAPNAKLFITECTDRTHPDTCATAAPIAL